MRYAPCLVAVLVAVGFASQVPVKKEKDPPTDAGIIDMVGGRFAKVYAQFGMPSDLRPIRSDESADLDVVFMDYGAFGFTVLKKSIHGCYFFDSWKTDVKGIKLGDSREQVTK